jgi:hypothetical protein
MLVEVLIEELAFISIKCFFYGRAPILPVATFCVIVCHGEEKEAMNHQMGRILPGIYFACKAIREASSGKRSDLIDVA